MTNPFMCSLSRNFHSKPTDETSASVFIESICGSEASSWSFAPKEERQPLRKALKRTHNPVNFK